MDRGAGWLGSQVWGVRVLSVRNVVLRTSRIHVCSEYSTCVHVWPIFGRKVIPLPRYTCYMYRCMCTCMHLQYEYLCMLLLDMQLSSLAQVAFCCLHPAAPYSLSVKGFNGVVALKSDSSQQPFHRDFLCMSSSGPFVNVEKLQTGVQM